MLCDRKVPPAWGISFGPKPFCSGGGDHLLVKGKKAVHREAGKPGKRADKNLDWSKLLCEENWYSERHN